jgi:hypothetical protein
LLQFRRQLHFLTAWSVWQTLYFAEEDAALRDGKAEATDADGTINWSQLAALTPGRTDANVRNRMVTLENQAARQVIYLFLQNLAQVLLGTIVSARSRVTIANVAD